MIFIRRCSSKAEEEKLSSTTSSGGIEGDGPIGENNIAYLQKKQDSHTIFSALNWKGEQRGLLLNKLYKKIAEHLKPGETYTLKYLVSYSNQSITLHMRPQTHEGGEHLIVACGEKPMIKVYDNGTLEIFPQVENKKADVGPAEALINLLWSKLDVIEVELKRDSKSFAQFIGHVCCNVKKLWTLFKRHADAQENPDNQNIYQAIEKVEEDGNIIYSFGEWIDPVNLPSDSSLKIEVIKPKDDKSSSPILRLTKLSGRGKSGANASRALLLRLVNEREILITIEKRTDKNNGTYSFDGTEGVTYHLLRNNKVWQISVIEKTSETREWLDLGGILYDLNNEKAIEKWKSKAAEEDEEDSIIYLLRTFIVLSYLKESPYALSETGYHLHFFRETSFEMVQMLASINQGGSQKVYAKLQTDNTGCWLPLIVDSSVDSSKRFQFLTEQETKRKQEKDVITNN